MSEHVIEDLVADSVRLLDGHAASSDPRVWDWFAKSTASRTGSTVRSRTSV